MTPWYLAAVDTAEGSSRSVGKRTGGFVNGEQPFFGVRCLLVPAALTPWIDCVFVNTSTPRSASHCFYRTPEADTYIMFGIDARATKAEKRSAVTRTTLVVSGAHRRLHAVPFPIQEALIFRLRPGAARSLGLPVPALADAIVPVEEIWPAWARSALERVAAEDSSEKRAGVLADLLLQRFQGADPGGRNVRFAGALVAACKANRLARDLAKAAGYSERQLRRVFDDCFGLGPKDFLRVQRFHSLLRDVGSNAGWADASLRHGYQDQSHLIHEFHALVGAPPERFVRELAAPELLRGGTVVRWAATH
jgi:AraC-like DNA-binding protein